PTRAKLFKTTASDRQAELVAAGSSGSNFLYHSLIAFRLSQLTSSASLHLRSYWEFW
ncbi:hypothetical protein J6590_086262, partial [Homalodisca vitripennis]